MTAAGGGVGVGGGMLGRGRVAGRGQQLVQFGPGRGPAPPPDKSSGHQSEDKHFYLHYNNVMWVYLKVVLEEPVEQ